MTSSKDWVEIGQGCTLTRGRSNEVNSQEPVIGGGRWPPHDCSNAGERVLATTLSQWRDLLWLFWESRRNVRHSCVRSVRRVRQLCVQTPNGLGRTLEAVLERRSHL